MDAVSIYDRFPSEWSLIDAFIQARFGELIPSCLHCGEDNVLRVDARLFRCRGCRRKFSILKGTLFERTKIDLRKWLYAILKMGFHARKGISSCELARDISVRQATAWKMLHKIRGAMAKDNETMGKLKFVVEADEAFFGGKPRRLNSKWVHGEEKPKTPVVTVVERPSPDRPGRARVTVPEPDHKGRLLTGPQLTDIIESQVDMVVSEIHTDGWSGYQDLDDLGHTHFAVNHGKRYVAAFGHVHCNTAESFHALPKRAYYGVYHRWAPEFVQAYAEECAWRWNNRRERPEARLSRVIELALVPHGKGRVVTVPPEPKPPRKRDYVRGKKAKEPGPVVDDGQMELF